MARGRRVNSSGEKSKKLLFEKAMELFSTYGYHQTKISDIVKAADLTQPTFYLYFQSKEALFKDLNTEFQMHFNAILNEGQSQLVTKQGTVSDKMLENLTQLFSYFVEHPNLTKIGFYGSGEAQQLKNELVQRVAQAIASEKEQYMIFKHIETNTIAESLVGSIERLTLTKLLTKETNPEKLAEEIINIYFVRKKELVR